MTRMVLPVKGTRNDRAVLVGTDNAFAKAGNGARFGRRDESRADPDAVGTERQCSRESSSVEHPTGRDDGNGPVHGVDNERHERKRRDSPGVPAGFGALCDDNVAAGVKRAASVLDLAAHRDDVHAVSVAEIDYVTRDA